MSYHRPVLLKESVDGLAVREDGVYVDITFGGGGHSREILERLGPGGRLIAFDQDEEALKNRPEDARIQIVNANFRFIKQYLKFYGILKVDGILGDFGVSSHQFDQAERGFSTRLDAVLDMRMSRKEALTAREVVNTYPLEQLRLLLHQYGELRRAGAIAGAIVKARDRAPIETTGQFNEVLRPFLQRGKENKGLAQVYQALRMEVNQELEALREFLHQSVDLVRPGGRLSLISYHSLEDRLVKRFMRIGKFEGEVETDFFGNPQAPFRPVGKLMVPSAEEISGNPRARSARLRVARRVEPNKG
ncbi:16S rRNA (cytosine(1402)-N(4))-methyltransferase RsmH [Robiginitalea marina]|uniref:Ribosomal RNA small subunit methyltransferase H n=1 Tax=Robiginitalea marina TaxID=2954105 RepID=A0ABT1AZH8_9FLAO|nr:16S rRNA (cytosine(1402)-N(4))-methyltransferase RsmH [Robiginitalea marina]MCO5724763.1 16S rRNA (cytosine(1402)-N(4))-methyltransferase RsmH [Robiginitalea marina]